RLPSRERSPFPRARREGQGKLTRRARRPAGGPVAFRKLARSGSTSRRWRRPPAPARRAMRYAGAPPLGGTRRRFSCLSWLPHLANEHVSERSDKFSSFLG